MPTETFLVSFEPLDVLVFRDYRGFDRGRLHDNRTVSPSPSAIRGCLRTSLFTLLQADFRKKDDFGVDRRWHGWLGDAKDAGSLQIRGPFLATGLRGPGPPQPLFPAPIDALFPDASATHEAPQARWLDPLDLDALRAAHPDLAPRFSLDLPPRLYWRQLEPKTKDGGSDEGPALLTAAGAACWASRGAEGVPPVERVLQSKVMQKEQRVGIARDVGRRTVKTAMFYLQETLRFQEGAGLLVEVDCASPDERALLQGLHGAIVPLGGRGHRVMLRVASGQALPPIPRGLGALRAWCVTPLVLSGGLQPAQGRLRALIAEEAMRLGSYDMAARRPRPLISALPAGAVLELDGVSVSEQIGPQSWGQPVEYAVAGFGTVILAGVPS